MISSIFLICLIEEGWALLQKSAASNQTATAIFKQPEEINLPMPSLAIVSAQFGERDKISSLTHLAEGVQGFFFTDNNDLDESRAGRGWTVVHRPYHLEHDGKLSSLDIHGKYSLTVCKTSIVRAVMAAKFYKLNAYLLDELEGMDMILWTDAANVGGRHALLDVLRVDYLASRAHELLGFNDFVAQKHAKRATVQEEIPAASVVAARQTEVIKDEMADDMWRGFEFMERQGFKDDLGLFHGESFLYRTKSPEVHAAMSYWWDFIQKFTFRDQISYPWALYFNNVKVAVPCQSGKLKGQSCIPRLLAEKPRGWN